MSGEAVKENGGKRESLGRGVKMRSSLSDRPLAGDLLDAVTSA